MRRHWPRAHVAAPCITHFILTDFCGIGTAFAETEPGLSFQAAVDLIPSYETVIAVFCADEEAGTFQDVTSDVADYFARLSWDELCPAAKDICERHGVAPDDRDSDEPLDGHAHQRREAVLAGHFV